MTSKQRMLAAYRGESTDRLPIAPEFWCYIPAKLLGIGMHQLERDGESQEGGQMSVSELQAIGP